MKKNYFLIIGLLITTLVNSQTIQTIAGNGTSGFSGDNGLAINAQLNYPRDVDADSYGNVYFTDRENNRIRKIDTNGIITTVAGTGVAGYSGDGSFAVNAQIHYPMGIKIDSNDNIYFVDNNNHCIRKINVNGIITTIAGNGTSGFSGDNGLAINSQLYLPQDIAIDSQNNIYIADSYNRRIRKIDVTNGIITTIGGNGNNSTSGDGNLAINSSIAYPTNLFVDNNANVYLCDWSDHIIREIDTNGIITTIAGIGTAGYTGDNGLATGAKLHSPSGITVINGEVYFADRDNQCIRKIDTNGIITTYAGGTWGCNADGDLIDFTSKSIIGLNYKNGELYIVNQSFCNTIAKITDNSLVIKDNILLNFSVYPIPTNNILNIKSKTKIIKLEVFSKLGQKIKETTKNHIDISNLSQGFYFVRVKDIDGNIGVKKIIKK